MGELKEITNTETKMNKLKHHGYAMIASTLCLMPLLGFWFLTTLPIALEIKIMYVFLSFGFHMVVYKCFAFKFERSFDRGAIQMARFGIKKKEQM